MQAVFISDLHLGPDAPDITERFLYFSQWILQKTKRLYILGDFFHAWPGDDLEESWVKPVRAALQTMVAEGIEVYFLAGNRDFLVGKKFCRENGITLLKEPTLLFLNNATTALVHGDLYCTNDYKHQWFRRLTRNGLFIYLFKILPLSLRKRLVAGVRNYSLNNKANQIQLGEVVNASVLKHLQRLNTTVVIHGHTHKPALHKQVLGTQVIRRYVLSDWDDSPIILCYDESIGYKFVQLSKEVTCAN